MFIYISGTGLNYGDGSIEFNGEFKTRPRKIQTLEYLKQDREMYEIGKFR